MMVRLSRGEVYDIMCMAGVVTLIEDEVIAADIDNMARWRER